ncbi:MAG TPA: hypothetical protein VF812_05120 [Ktedonobacterales bacterium]
MAGMNGRIPDDADHDDMLDEDEDDLEDDEYDALVLLDRLESLEDEMQELGVTTLDELRARIRELHAEMGD